MNGGEGGKRRGTPKVDFTKVGMGALRKYKKAHRVRIKVTNNKAELAEAVAKHFAQLPPPEDEAEVIEAFANAVRSHERERKRKPKSPQK